MFGFDAVFDEFDRTLDIGGSEGSVRAPVQQSDGMTGPEMHGIQRTDPLEAGLPVGDAAGGAGEIRVGALASQQSFGS